eukprot:tig00000241_g20997.t1
MDAQGSGSSCGAGRLGGAGGPPPDTAALTDEDWLKLVDGTHPLYAHPLPGFGLGEEFWGGVDPGAPVSGGPGSAPRGPELQLPGGAWGAPSFYSNVSSWAAASNLGGPVGLPPGESLRPLPRPGPAPYGRPGGSSPHETEVGRLPRAAPGGAEAPAAGEGPYGREVEAAAARLAAHINRERLLKGSRRGSHSSTSSARVSTQLGEAAAGGGGCCPARPSIALSVLSGCTAGEAPDAAATSDREAAPGGLEAAVELEEAEARREAAPASPSRIPIHRRRPSRTGAGQRAPGRSRGARRG